MRFAKLVSETMEVVKRSSVGRKAGSWRRLETTLLVALFAAACGDGADREASIDLLETRGTLVMGQSVAAVLTVTDLVVEVEGDPVRASAWEVRVDSGQQVQVDMMSDAFDSHLFIAGPGIPVPLADDDGGVGRDARLCFRAPVAGSYRVVAAALGEVGDYSLSALDGCDGIPARFRQLEARGSLVVGQRIGAALTPTDPVIDADETRRAAAWEIRVDRGQQVQIEMTSAAFDPYLYVVGPGMASPLAADDGGEELDARLCLRAAEAGTYRVIASGFEAGGVGDYSLVALDGCFGTARLNQLEALGTLRVGQSLAATLADTTSPVDGRHPVAWEIPVDSGRQVQIELMSDAFDPYLYIMGSGLAFALTDDDGGSGQDARICFSAPETDTYRVVAAALDGRMGDYYVLSARDACGGTSARPGLLNARDTLVAGQTMTGTLAETDLLIDRARAAAVTEAGRLAVDGPRAAGWAMQVERGQSIQVDMTSDAFDPVLYILDPGRELLLTDDDGGLQFDAHLCLGVEYAGTYTVVAGALDGGVGGYSLSARDGCDGIPARLRQLETRGALALGRPVAATLTNADSRVIPGQFAAGWELPVGRGQEVQIDMVSDAFDPAFFVAGPGIESQYGNSDGGAARLCFTAPEAGTYRVVAAVPLEGGAGDYWLGATDGCDGVSARLRLLETRGTLAVGRQVRGALTGDGFSVERGRNRRAAAWGMRLRAGQEVQIEMTSDALDPFLYIVGPGMAGPRTDNDGGLGLNARLCFRAPESGTYRVVAAAGDGETGDYSLSTLDGCPVG